MVNEQKLLSSMRELIEVINYKLLGMKVRDNVVTMHMAYEHQAVAIAQALRRANFEEVTLRPAAAGFIVTADYVNKEKKEPWQTEPTWQL